MPGLTEGTCIDVRSKMMAVDDEWLRIGSANAFGARQMTRAQAGPAVPLGSCYNCAFKSLARAP